MSNTRAFVAVKPLVIMVCFSLLSIFSISSVTAADLTGNITLTSNYIFRGLDRSNRSPAVQGGYDWSHGSGLYTGVWASSVSTHPEGSPLVFETGPDGSIEVDGYFGYVTEWQKYGLGMDVGFIHYRFPHTSDENNEVYGVVSFKGLSGSIWYEFNENTENLMVDGELEEIPSESNANTFIYGKLAYEVTLGPEIGISVAVGQQTLDTDFDKTGAELDDIVDWSLGIGKTFFGVDFSLKYSDTNLDTDEKTEFVVLSLSKSL